MELAFLFIEDFKVIQQKLFSFDGRFHFDIKPTDKTLIDIYRAHLDVVGELIVKCDRLSKGYANSLAPLFPGLHTNRAEFHRFHFGNYFNEKDFHRRPLAKMTKDIVQQALPSFLHY